MKRRKLLAAGVALAGLLLPENFADAEDGTSLLLRAGAVGPPVFYVAANGNDSNDGTTPATPWLTAAKVAATTFIPGTQVLFRGGDTFGALAVRAPLAVTTIQAPVVYGSYGTGRATLTVASGNGVIFIQNFGNVSVTNLILVATGTCAQGVYLSNNAVGSQTFRNILMFNLDISGATGAGMDIDGELGEAGWVVAVTGCVSHNNTGVGFDVFQTGTTKPHTVTFTSCTSNNNGQDGILLGGCTGGGVFNCIAHHNGAGSASGPVGIWAYDSNAVVIRYCESYSNTTAGNDGDGFDLDVGCVNCIMEYNYSHDNGGDGFLIYASNSGHPNVGSIVRFNLSVNDASIVNRAGILIGAGTSTSTTGAQIYNNTVINSIAGRQCVRHLGGTVTASFANNIFYSTVKFIDTVGLPTGCIFQGNCYFGGGIITWNGVTYTSVAAWQAAITAQEKVAGVNVAVTTDPKLVDVTAHPTVDGYVPSALGAFKPQAGSSTFGAGINLNAVLGITKPTTDYYGGAANANYDIGAAFQSSAA